MDEHLQQLGLGKNAATVYRALLSSGPSSVRKIAVAAAMNRGTAYDQLKQLILLGLVSYYHKKKKK